MHFACRCAVCTRGQGWLTRSPTNPNYSVIRHNTGLHQWHLRLLRGHVVSPTCPTRPCQDNATFHFISPAATCPSGTPSSHCFLLHVVSSVRASKKEEWVIRYITFKTLDYFLFFLLFLFSEAISKEYIEICITFTKFFTIGFNKEQQKLRNI